MGAQTPVLKASLTPPEKTLKPRWHIVAVLVTFHIGALAALFLFDWIAFGFAFGILCVTGCLGVTVGFHRCLTHGGFQTFRPVKWMFGLFGGLAGQADVVDWVALHRKHHQFSDVPGEDPHTPRDGPWWSHMCWFLVRRSKEEMESLRKRYAPDLLKDKMLVFFGKYHFVWLGVLAGLLVVAGLLIGGWLMAVQMVLWGMCARLVFMWHSTWAVNSVCHLWGYRNYGDTGDDSRNNPLIALITFGEGFHENHHADQVRANHGFHRWWEFDPSYVAIRLLWMCGLAWGIKDRFGVTRSREAAAAG